MGGQAWQHPGDGWRPGAEAVVDSPQNGMALGTVVTVLGLSQLGNRADQGTKESTVGAIHPWARKWGNFLAGQEAANSVSKITGWF